MKIYISVVILVKPKKIVIDGETTEDIISSRTPHVTYLFHSWNHRKGENWTLFLR
jgi:hypothetical protein